MGDNEMVHGLLKHVKQDEPRCPLCEGKGHDTRTCPLAPRNKNFIEEREKHYRENAGDPVVDRFDNLERRMDQFDLWREELFEGVVASKPVLNLCNETTMIKRAFLSLIGLLVTVFLIGIFVLAELNTRVQQEIRDNREQAAEIQKEIEEVRRCRIENMRLSPPQVDRPGGCDG